jgi:hypothetical protein
VLLDSDFVHIDKYTLAPAAGTHGAAVVRWAYFEVHREARYPQKRQRTVGILTLLPFQRREAMVAPPQGASRWKSRITGERVLRYLAAPQTSHCDVYATRGMKTMPWLPATPAKDA